VEDTLLPSAAAGAFPDTDEKEVHISEVLSIEFCKCINGHFKYQKKK
jgi:hypothetical protein